MASLNEPLDLPSGLRLARGQEPDLNRGARRTAAAMVRRNGHVSLTPRRGLT